MKYVAGRTPNRIEFYITDIFGKEFRCYSIPYRKGDAVKGELRKAKKLVLKSREISSGILRSDHGFQGMRLGIKVDMIY